MTFYCKNLFSKIKSTYVCINFNNLIWSRDYWSLPLSVNYFIYLKNKIRLMKGPQQMISPFIKQNETFMISCTNNIMHYQYHTFILSPNMLCRLWIIYFNHSIAYLVIKIEFEAYWIIWLINPIINRNESLSLLFCHQLCNIHLNEHSFMKQIWYVDYE